VTGPLVVPVGRYLGMLPVDGATLRHVVRVGGRRVGLTDDEHLVWALAHGLPGAPDLGRWNRAAVRRNLADGTGADATIDRLIGTGLLAETTGTVEEFARSVRLLPQALGLGNDPVDGRTFRVGYPETPLVAVSTEVFFLWSWAGVDKDLWTACARAATTARPDGSGDPRALASVLLGTLHVLLSTNVACLDRALAA
jgi:hypothetical protein